jgi:acyl-coenzyme A thioesterase PaaI-like protein
MTLREVDPGVCRRVFEGELDEHWTVGPKVHGGAMLALCANAARGVHGGAVEPIAVSGSFLWAPDPGPMRLVTSVRKRGRRISVVDVELSQAGRTAVHAVVTLGEPEHLLPPLLSANPVIGLMAPEPPPDVAPIGPPGDDAGRLGRGGAGPSARVIPWPDWCTWQTGVTCGRWSRRWSPPTAARRWSKCGYGRAVPYPMCCLR